MVNIIDLFDKQLMDDNNKRGKDYSYTSHHPSSYTKCLRQVWYKWKKVPESDPSTAAGLIRMGLGNSAHYWIQQVFFKIFPAMREVLFYKEVPELKYPIRGYADNIFCMPKENLVFGAEYKTSYGRGIKHIQETKMPREDATNQSFLYLSLPLASPMLPDYLTSYYLMYLGRDDAYRTGFWLTRKGKEYFVNNKLVDWDITKVVPRFKLLEDYLTDDALPPREFKMEFKTRKGEVSINKAQSDWQCLYCQYAKECYGIKTEKDTGGE